jgi:hypothetical protein
MAYTQNSISSLVAQFLRLQKNALEIINGLNQVATSTNDTVEIQLLDELGFPTTSSIPAYGYLRSQIQRLDSNVQALAGLGANFSTVRNPDGTYSQIYKASPLRDPSPLVGLPVPSTFSIKDNWFFESFLSPLLYISIDVTGQIPDESDRIKIKRIIANTVTDAQKTYFDQNLKGRNDVTEVGFINALTAGGIGYFTDEDIIPLPLRSIRYSGNFSVLGVFDSVVSTTDANNQTVQQTVRNYKLNSLNYTDTSSNILNGKTLAVNDNLLTLDGSMYQIVSVNINETTVQLRRVSGFQPVQEGADTLSLSSTDLGPRSIQVNVGYNERQGVFFKKIDDNYNIVSTTWSTGITFFSNELRINTTAGIQTLETFYLNSVADIGQLLLSAAKEKKVPSYDGLVPNVPTLVDTNFKVVQINTQLTAGTSIEDLNSKVSAKTALQSEIVQLDSALANARSVANSNTSSIVSSNVLESVVSPIQSATSSSSVQAQINNLTVQRTQKQQLLSSLVQDITTLSQSTPSLFEAPKYRVRGFWAIPEPVVSPKTGPQQVIQFSVQYRYLSDSGSANPIQQVDYIDNNGQTKTGAFSNWNEYKTEIRKKVYDAATGTYVWAPEITADADANNVNQLDIPITRGERVEIRIKSISEAGWPDNPQTSDFSESVIISFPADLSVQSASANTTTNLKDAAVLEIQQDLQSRGIDGLLNKQVVYGAKTYYLDAASIYSGTVSSSGQPMDLLQKINELQDQISSLQAVVEKAVGTLEVYVVLPDGTSAKMSPGSIFELPPVIYNQVFPNPTTADAGRISSSIYSIQILNSSSGLLELSSALPGGLNTLAGSSNTYTLPDGYAQNLRYGEIPISITSLNPSNIVPPGSQVATVNSFQLLQQASPYMSANENGQFIYPRWKSVGLDSTYYVTPAPYIGSYSYGTIAGQGPLDGSALLPFSPSSTTPVYPNGGINGSVWNGGVTGTTGSYVGTGNGYISEFCISKDHPAIALGDPDNTTNTIFTQLVTPDFSNDGSVVYPYFRHSDYFYTDVNSATTTTTNPYAQLGWSEVDNTFATGPTASRTDSMYPNKLGFDPNDQYLIGKYTCGAYLFLGPPTTSLIQVEGSTALASRYVKQGTANSINVPLIFQFRATDNLGFIGGYRLSGNPSNIIYQKKIGIDIQVRNSAPFSFDLLATGSYKKQTLAGFGIGSASSPSGNALTGF